MVAAAWVCLFLPLGATLLIALRGNGMSRRAAGWLSTLSVAGSFAAAVVAFALMLGEQPEQRTSHTSTAWEWLTAGNLRFGLTILVDPLSVMMMLIVAGVGALIVGYSIGYMDAEDEERRFFAYMALFVFSMLLLVEGGNLLMLLAGWGLVGLSSYLLIGFYHQRPSAVAAAKKAFIMNAFGDATMALALFLLIQQTGTLDYQAVFSKVDGLSTTVVVLVALGLLGGAVAKSAQLPLQTWLPDAMEGPTPVSALIHAATMVTAGVYLIVRTAPIFEQAPTVQDIAAGLGTATLVLAGLIALVQTDVKRVIAYSTMSQIGYMFLGAGIGAYSAAMFHLMTHAFFKALLFLGAGIVIHALGGEQDIRRMGGLGRTMRLTALAMLVGGLSLSAIPPFSGFWSKDSILDSALADGTYGYVLYVCGVVGAFLTGLYTFRMLIAVFGGGQSAHLREHPPHESHGVVRWTMGLTVGTLAVLSVVGGFLQVAYGSHLTAITDWLDPVAPPLVEASTTQEIVGSVISVSMGTLGILTAWLVYSRHAIRVPRPWALLEQKFYFDRLYDAVFYRPAVATTRLLYALVEGPLVAGSIAGIAAGVRDLGGWARELQTGLVRTYVLAIAASLAVLTLVFIAVR
ncbi:MAG TPA: NADH-quinone oxidoreductase subunit L [Solirubrobacterales bacterium]|nr:NADH-quinone oxidoreductase subunit L [Solirubrobacterales bacterium]